jgi:lipopolysaccharide biosynthesis protein
MKRAILLAHYDRDGIIDPYVIVAAKEYRRFADTLALISVSTRVLPTELHGVVDYFIPRDNVGYDFGSWRAGLETIGTLSDFDEIICVNDSVYGPLFDLAPALSSPRHRDADFWGMTISDQIEPHVQSWFFAMRPRVIQSETFRQFWAASAGDLPKDDIIKQREIGFSAALGDAGYRIAAVYDGRDRPVPSAAEKKKHWSWLSPLRTRRYCRKTRARKAPFNPSELFYDRLWESGVPFLKRRVFTTNFYGLSLPLVKAELRQLSPHWAELIVNHLHRIGRAP